jgi:hypothetical protein
VALQLRELGWVTCYGDYASGQVLAAGFSSGAKISHGVRKGRRASQSDESVELIAGPLLVFCCARYRDAQQRRLG